MRYILASFVVVFNAFFITASYSAPINDKILSLPGYGKLTTLEYAGYSSLSKTPCSDIKCTNTSALFYWFIAGKNNATDQPIILWSNGGPGSSSLYGLFMENGPYRVNDNLTLTLAKNSWSEFANYLVIDHPLSTGLSFGEPTNYPKNVAQGVEQYYFALKNFLVLHPEYRHNPIFLAGESYAGTYLPLLATKILQENTKNTKQQINLKGMIIISGWVDPIIQQSMDASYAVKRGLISSSQQQSINQLYVNCKNAILHQDPKNPSLPDETCDKISNTIEKLSGKYLANIKEKNSPSDNNFVRYLNQKNVRLAIHANPTGIYSDYSEYIGNTYEVGEQSSYLNLYSHLLSSGIPILFFTGLDDAKDSNYLGAQAWMNQLSWQGKFSYQDAKTKIWRENMSYAALGYIKEGGNFEWITVLNAGHLVPLDQPKINQPVKDFITEYKD